MTRVNPMNPDERKESFLHISPFQNQVTLYSHNHCNCSKEGNPQLHSELVPEGLITHNLWPKVSFPSHSGPFTDHKAFVFKDILNEGCHSFYTISELALAQGSPWVCRSLELTMWTESPRRAVTKAEHGPGPSRSSLQQQLSSGDPQIHNLQIPDFNKTKEDNIAF